MTWLNWLNETTCLSDRRNPLLHFYFSCQSSQGNITHHCHENQIFLCRKTVIFPALKLVYHRFHVQTYMALIKVLNFLFIYFFKYTLFFLYIYLCIVCCLAQTTMNVPVSSLRILDAVYHGALRFIIGCKTITNHCTSYSTCRLLHW